MTGRLSIVGLGPGAEGQMTPDAREAVARASDIVGYATYVARLPERSGQRRHVSDNRREIDRACHALELAAGGHDVAVVSSGDPGVFAMAAAVFEALEAGDVAWRALEITVIPGVSAMLAAAARVGAPLGHDFCCISLSDNLKPWETVLGRLRAAAEADFVMALYNPISKARPWQLGLAFEALLQFRHRDTPVIFASAVGRADEQIELTTLGESDPARADMRTLVIVGSSATRTFERPNGEAWVYTPRRAVETVS